ncbi:MAG TPA: hypothetical protein VFF28_04760 [Candidatus Nanoarchaeia archaeon]|nr:hypothetical protein [Candidatus Nanoarchaeia archaeon]
MAKSNLRDKLHYIFGHIMAIVALVIVVIVFGGAYYFIIAPNLVSKPSIEKPAFSENAIEEMSEGKQAISPEHINYLVNELDGYKLKNTWGDKLPIIEFLFTDTNVRYYSYVKDHVPITKEGNAKGNDILIKGSQQVAYEIIESGNIPQATKQAVDSGKLSVELVSDMKTLATKGYLSIYDNVR